MLGAGVQGVAFEYWGEHPDRELPQLVDEVLDELAGCVGSDH